MSKCIVSRGLASEAFSGICLSVLIWTWASCMYHMHNIGSRRAAASRLDSLNIDYVLEEDQAVT